MCSTLGPTISLAEGNKYSFALLMGTSLFWPDESSLTGFLLERARESTPGCLRPQQTARGVSQAVGASPLILTQLQLKVSQLGLTFGSK